MILLMAVGYADEFGNNLDNGAYYETQDVEFADKLRLAGACIIVNGFPQGRQLHRFSPNAKVTEEPLLVADGELKADGIQLADPVIPPVVPLIDPIDALISKNQQLTEQPVVEQPVAEQPIAEQPSELIEVPPSHAKQAKKAKHGNH